MTTNYRALCAELVDKLHEHTSMWEGHKIDLVTRARAALAQPEPEGPTDEEVDAWADQQGFIRGHGDHPCGFWIDDGDAGSIVRTALARWGCPEPQPVPEEPTDDELMDIARATDLVFYMGKGCGFASPYMEETDITAEVLAFAREVLARYGGSTSSSIKA